MSAQQVPEPRQNVERRLQHGRNGVEAGVSAQGEIAHEEQNQENWREPAYDLV